MSILVQCPSCAREYNLPESFLGKTLKCKKCGDSFTAKAPKKVTRLATNPDAATSRKKTRLAPAEDAEAIEPAPARKRDRDEVAPPSRPKAKSTRASRRQENSDDEPIRRRPSRARDDDDEDEAPPSKMKLWIGLGAGGVSLVLVVVLCIVLLGRGGNQPAQPGPGDIAQGGAPNPPPRDPVRDPPIKDAPPKDPFKVKEPPFKTKDPDKTAPDVLKWQVKPDPAPDLPALMRQGEPVSLNLESLARIITPNAPSAFLAIHTPTFGKESFRILDVFTLKEMDAITTKVDLSEPVLSAAGKHIAGKAFRGNKANVEVWSVSSGKAIFNLANDGTLLIHRVDFAEPGNVMVIGGKGVTIFAQTWNFLTRQKVSDFPLPALTWSHAEMSPNGKYLAVPSIDRIDFVTTAEGKLVGRLAVPKAGFGTVKALKFSPDGQELALYRSVGVDRNNIVAWKMSNGSLSVQHSLAVDKKNQFKLNKSFEWLADRSGWFIDGETILDYVSGQPVFNVVKNNNELSLIHFAPRIIGKDSLLRIKSASFKSTLEVVPLPKDEIAQAVKDARSGVKTTVGDDPPPLVKKGDDANVKVLPPPSGPMAWKVPVDKSPPAANATSQPVALDCTAKEIMHVHFARPDVLKAVVLYAKQTNALSKKRTVRADRIDLATGKSMGIQDLFSSDESVASPASSNISPDGGRLLMRITKDPKKLTMWDLADGKQITAWAPYGDDIVGWFAFLDADHVLTLGGRDRLILWKMPECKAIYAIDGFKGRMQLSPSGKLLLGSTGTSLELLDPASGERLGQLQTQGESPASLDLAAFSPAGDSLAVMYKATGGARMQLGVWSLANGSCTTTFPARKQPTMSWVGPKQLLCKNEIVDLSAKTAIVSYGPSASFVAAQGRNDSRLWVLAGDASGKNPAELRSAPVPDEKARQIGAAATAGSVRSLLPPGAKFQINVNTNVEKVRTTVQQQWPNTLQREGFTLEPGDMTLTINAQESPTGKMIDYEVTPIGKFKGKLVKVAERQITVQLTITDAKGAIVYAPQPSVCKTPFTLRFEGDDFQQKLDDDMRRTAASIAGNNLPLASMFHIQGEIRQLPMTVPLFK